MTLLKSAVTSAALLAGGLVAATPQDADAQVRFSFGSGYGGYGGYGGYYGDSHYGHGHGYGYDYGRRGRVWHDTSHYDYHPGGFQRHYDHYHYVPGHYDFHRDGHWDRGRRGHRHHDHDD